MTATETTTAPQTLPGEFLLMDPPRSAILAAGSETGRNQRKQYSRPSCEPMTSRPAARAGEADSGAPASNCQSSLPVVSSSTYSRLSLEPTYTRPLAIAGEDSTRPWVANVQRSRPVAASRPCNILSRPPTTTLPSATAAEE